MVKDHGQYERQPREVVLHSPSLSSIPIFDKRYRSAFRESPSRRAACDLLPPARFKASRIISSSHWSSVMPSGRKRSDEELARLRGESSCMSLASNWLP